MSKTIRVFNYDDYVNRRVHLIQINQHNTVKQVKGFISIIVYRIK